MSTPPPSDPKRTPVLVGVGEIVSRERDPRRAREALDLMQAALEAAAADAGAPGLLREAGAIAAPRGFWRYGDPCRALALRFGCPKATTIVAEIGVLQTTLVAEAAERIASGEAEVVLVVGAEAKFRALRAQIEGVAVDDTPCEGEADRVLRPHADILHPLELALDIAMPVKQYAVMENALRRALGQDVAAHRAELARLYAAFSAVAARNPFAWRREPVAAEAIERASDANPMLAFPYTKLHTSQWNVDQAAGLVLCSLAAAERHGVPRERCVFPLAVAESNHMVPLAERAEPERCHGVAIAGERLAEIAGVAARDAEHLELYSCFPSAVRMQARELGIALDRPLTVTGGMAFGGGPLNNFVLQAIARMAHVLRADPGSRGLVTAVSGMLTKQGLSLWSTAPGERPFAAADATDAVARALPTVAVDDAFAGPARVHGYTVLYEGGAPARVVALCDADGGRRALAACDDAALLARAERDELGGLAVRVRERCFEPA
ncbi:MAG: acetyl-CoA acetyltransferase [Myxococcota bacterium]